MLPYAVARAHTALRKYDHPVAGLLLSNISTLLENVNDSRKQGQQLRDKMASVDAWLAERKIPQRLRRRIRAFFAEVCLTGLASTTASLRLI